jgi:xylitol oxidase
MRKRTFLKLTSALMAAPVVSPIASWLQDEKLKNWAGNIEYSTTNISYPRSVDELVQLMKKHSKLKILGSRHCFNRIADSTDRFISLKEMNKVVSIDTKASTVTIEGGMNYGQLCPILNDKGFALHNLASLPHISVAGACCTATHGSGVKNGNLATPVSAIEFVSADGTIVNLSKKKDGEKFLAAVVGLGTLGAITKLTLDIQPAFSMKQYVFEKMPMSQLKDHFDEVLSAAYSVSLFTDWQSDSINEVWIKAVDNDKNGFSAGKEFFGGKAATKNMHPIAELSAENCTEQMGVAGPWYERLPHFKMGFTPSSGVELQAEYFIPRKYGMDAILAIAKMGKEIGPHLFISEIRTIDQDNLWMSPCYKEPCITIHFTWKQDWPAVSKLLPVIEKELAPYRARPHWGKLFTMPAAALHTHYQKLDEFQKFVSQYDPKGKFRNEFLERNIYSV